MADFQQLDELDAGGASDDNPQESGAKRKRNDTTASQHRAKRNRYISIACNECKRRKIKCNGETPCQRCGNLSLDCVYSPNCCSNSFKDSPEFKQMNAQIASLQEQIDHLSYTLGSLRNSLGQDSYDYSQDPLQLAQDASLQPDVAPDVSMAIDPALQTRIRQRSSPQQARFQGPTSSGFSLGVAQSSLRNMGIASAEDAINQAAFSQDDENSRRTSSNNPKPLIEQSPQMQSPSGLKALHPSKDPIWALSKDEALRLCRVFEDETYMMYPLLDMPSILRHAGMLFQFIDALSKSVMVSSMPGADAMQDQDTDLLKLVLAITLVIEGAGRSELGQKLFDNVNRGTDTRLLGSVNVKDVQILTLTSLYHFHTDDEGLAWRVIGLTARLCLELGLHRSERYSTLFETEQERMTGLRLFWSIYVLDHRWSFGTGMSFALQESDIDNQLPKPTESSPYLSAMIDYCNISAKCWKYIATANPTNPAFSKDDIHHLDFQIMQWYRNLPDQLRLVHPNSVEFSQHESDPNEAVGRSLYRQRVLLHLRRNQMRIAIYRTVLYSSSAMQSSMSTLNFAETAVEVAKDTIRILTHINTRSDIYTTRQVTYNHFLLSALSVLFLAVCHAPAQFAESCRDEFYMALDLVRRLSANSFVSKRLWRTIRGLKKLAPKIGLFARHTSKSASNGRKPTPNPGDNSVNGYPPHDTSQRRSQTPFAQTQSPSAPQNDAQRSAAMAMAGLAGHPMDETAFFADNAPRLDSPSIIGITSSDKRTGQLTTSPNGIANELTSLFEAAGAYANGGPMGLGASMGTSTNSSSPQEYQQMSGDNVPVSVAGGANGRGLAGTMKSDTMFWDTNDEDLNKILKELF